MTVELPPRQRRTSAFDVRGWLARESGCDRDALRLTDGRVRSDFSGAFDATYACGPNFAGRVLVGPPKTNIETEPPRRSVVAVWPTGTASTRIEADARIEW